VTWQTVVLVVEIAVGEISYVVSLFSCFGYSVLRFAQQKITLKCLNVFRAWLGEKIQLAMGSGIKRLGHFFTFF
jgi:hypothetical protein